MGLSHIDCPSCNWHRIPHQVAKNNLRIKEIKKVLSRSSSKNDDSSDSDEDLEDLDGLRSELESLENANADNQAKLDHYAANKKWNVDNMCHVVEERTIVNKNVEEKHFSESGYALPTETPHAIDAAKKNGGNNEDGEKSAAKEGKPSDRKNDVVPTEKMSKAKIDNDSVGKKTNNAASTSTTVTASTTPRPPQLQPQLDEANSVSVSMLSYHEFTEKYADVVEQFMAIQSMDRSKEFLLQKGDILLQENASNYLLLASLEDEMNGYHDKMKLVARQSQIISNIAELAKSLKLHPGNVIHPFFARMQNKELFEGFMEGVREFIQRIEARAITKRKEMDKQRAREMKEPEINDVSEVPLGPGGLHPQEVFDSLPVSMQEAFESREKENLEAALRALPPEEAEYHMKRCVDSGLWNAWEFSLLLSKFHYLKNLCFCFIFDGLWN